jgi:hypothetical protein
VNFSDIIGCITSPWCRITNPWSLDPPGSGARARTRSFEIHGSTRALSPQPARSRLHGLVIRHKDDELYPSMSKNSTFEYLEFSNMVGPWFSNIF